LFAEYFNERFVDVVE